ncbi:hypothetical protein LshimejAT787_0209550 [Lyophyllum shimeji]|uniref:Uncharacterized protein n=1 Tax=Lyophyllum shimeji TaxID=47721 RepID=A0A9P3PG58_LYOSH|nr:hypothetical protein LshimejAT787_0209550 [Lyophyllum shimeji]
MISGAGTTDGLSDAVEDKHDRYEPDISELTLILDEVMSGEPEATLTREDAGDVALDMDVSHYIDFDDLEVSSGSEDGDDGDEDQN